MFVPTLPRYDIGVWRTLPFAKRLELACRAWAEQGYGSPLAVYGLYVAKIAAYIGVWLAACTLGPERDLANLEQWWSGREAFAKVVVWTMLFEGLGFGCGSGPLTGRYVPPLGGALYFLRPGTTKLPLFPRLPLMGHRRTVLDAVAYAVVIGLLVRALVAPMTSGAGIDPSLIVPVLVLVPVLGLLDKTLFLVFRSEHYLSSLVCLLFPEWIEGNKLVWLAIWWWAATSKVNAHFPAVMCVMTSNAPWTRVGPLRRWVYRDFPNDLRPSRFAGWMAHTGTVAEYVFPLALLVAGAAYGGGPVVAAVLVFGSLFHLFIMSNVPMGVPLEWNVVMIYGAWVLFGVHADVSVLGVLDAPILAAWLAGFHVLLPAYGSQFPAQVSFLLSMRYYAGNWAYSVWLFRPSALEKLAKGTVRSAPMVEDQLRMLYDEDTITALMSKVVAFRAMHLHGRALHSLLPKAVDAPSELDELPGGPLGAGRVWLDGEIVAGLVLGWNFGDGHLHDRQLLAAVHEQCAFEPGELRCVFVESQPIFGRSLAYVVADAATGVIDAGEVPVAELVDAHPWPTVAAASG